MLVEFRHVKVVDALVARAIHFCADVERQIQRLALRNEFVQLLRFGGAHRGVGEVPVAVGHNIGDGEALGHKDAQQFLTRLLALRKAVHPAHARERTALDNKLGHFVNCGERAAARLHIADAPFLHQFHAHGVAVGGRRGHHFVHIAARHAQALGPEAHHILRTLFHGADVRLHNVALGGVAIGGQRQHIAFVVYDNGGKVCVDALDHALVARA